MVKYKKVQRFKENYHFFILFGCLMANIEPLLSVTHPMLSTAFTQVSTRRSLGASKRNWAPKPGRALSGVWTRNLPIHLQGLNPLGHSPQVRVFKMIWFVVASFWDFLAYLLYFQMKSQLLKVIDTFKLSSSRQQWWWAFDKKGFAQVAQVHISPDGPVLKSWQEELISSIRILVII